MSNWILKNGTTSVDCASFPFAYRTAFNLVRKATEAKQPASTVTNNITIIGPPNVKGERTKYSYLAATQLALEQGLLTNDGLINSREFKRR